LIGSIFALVQYYDKSSAARAKVSLEYVERFNRPPLQDARSRLEKFWDKRAEEVFAKNQVSEKALADFLINNVRKFNLNGDIELVVEFFEDLHTCTCEKVCDEALAKRFFGKYSFDFYGLMFPYLADQRRRLNDQSIGLGIELFAKTQRTRSIDVDLSCRV